MCPRLHHHGGVGGTGGYSCFRALVAPSKVRRLAPRPARLRQTRRMTDVPSQNSAFGRLLEEISWEGNARKYHDGGLGKENVLVAEVFSALDYLPRLPFLGTIIRGADGGNDDIKTVVADDVEQMTLTVLPGDIQPRHLDDSDTSFRVQPDVLIESQTTCCLIEAKRIRRSQFQEDQLLRTLFALKTYAGQRSPLLLLVTAEPAPIRVQNLGRVSIEESVEHSLEKVTHRQDKDAIRLLAAEHTALTTWTQISTIAAKGSSQIGPLSGPAEPTIRRLAHSICEAVARHA